MHSSAGIVPYIRKTALPNFNETLGLSRHLANRQKASGCSNVSTLSL